jgi:hypothetical protein
MLIIRREQMQVLQEEAWNSFLREILARARGDMPEQLDGKSDGDLFEVLQPAMKNVRSRGFIRTPDIVRYGMFVLRLGADPAKDAAIAPVLKNPRLSGAAKLDALERMLPERHGIH